ncbi:MAG: type II secretion system GspH family protein [Puniceicoccales bacterium]|jgi:prepilin-type N-terminal cleavage/methylation domain-containing protein|nr:type II secretion system GspH family protein [Puniceicoccales bacterium]
MNAKYRAFTLIEVLAVIAIIGLLSTLLTPAVGSAMARARKMRVTNNLRQISISYAAYVNGGGSLKKLNEAQTLSQWAAVLAANGGAGDASLYIIPEDYLVINSTAQIPRQILAPGTSAAASTEFQNFPLGIVVIAGLSPDDDPSATPLAYSRGLDQISGHWKAQNGDDGGVYGQSGGFVLFLDGHVIWYNSLAENGGELTNFETGGKTSSIRDAVRSGAKAIGWKGAVWTNSTSSQE